MSGGCATAAIDVTALLQPQVSPRCCARAMVGSVGAWAGPVAAPSTATELGCPQRSWRSSSPTAMSRPRCHRRKLDSWPLRGDRANDLYDGQTIDARPRVGRVAAAGILRRQLDRRASVELDFDRANPWPSVRPSGVRRSCSQSRFGRRLPLAGLWSTSGRTWWGGYGLSVRARPVADHAAACRGARARRAGYPAAANRAKQPTTSSSAAATTCSSRRSPSTASVTPRSTGWPGELPADAITAVVRLAPSCGGSATFSAQMSCSTSSISNVGVGTARQLPRRANRLPAAGRAARLDR